MAFIVECRAAAAPEALVIYGEMKAHTSCSVIEGFINHLYAGCLEKLSLTKVKDEAGIALQPLINEISDSALCLIPTLY